MKRPFSNSYFVVLESKCQESFGCFQVIRTTLMIYDKDYIISDVVFENI